MVTRSGRPVGINAALSIPRVHLPLIGACHRPPMRRTASRAVGLAAGWALTLLGVVLFPLPGPGLLLIAVGLAILARHHSWAERRVEQVRLRALRGAAAGVQTRARAGWAVCVSLLLTASGLLWLVEPSVPDWWVLPEWLWFPGGPWSGAGQALSGLVALALVVHSYRRYHGRPDALAQLDAELARMSRDPVRP